VGSAVGVIRGGDPISPSRVRFPHPATERAAMTKGAIDKSLLLLFFRKEEECFSLPLRGGFFFEKKKQKTFIW
jgi:hypothetical protein